MNSFPYVILMVMIWAVPIFGQVPSAQRVPLVPGSTIGVIGGIPAPFSNVSNVVVYGADPTGASSSVTAIQNLINTVPDNTTIYIPNGVFDIRGGISIERNNICINGAGTNSILVGNMVIGQDGAAGSVYGANYSLPVSNTIPLTVGDTNLVFVVNQDNQGNTVSVGDAFQISSLIYSSDLTNFQYISTSTGDYGATFAHLLAQEIYITGVSGNVYSFWPPLAWNFTNTPVAFPRNYLLASTHNLYQMKTNIGLANFTLTGSNSASMTSPQNFQLSVDMVRNFYITNCNILWCQNHNIYMIDTVNTEIAGSWIAWTFLPPASNQGGLLLYAFDGAFIYNSIFQGGFPAIEWDNPGVGLVMFANFFTNNAADAFEHISHDIQVVAEMNVGDGGFQVDGYFGSASHQIFWRNRMWGDCTFNRFSTYMSAAGNVIGNPGSTYVYITTNNNYSGSTMFQIGYPNRGNQSYDSAVPTKVWNYPGDQFAGFNSDTVLNNGYFVITNTQLNTNIIVGSFTNLPSTCTGNGSCFQYGWMAQDIANTNIYWPLGSTTNNTTYPESSNLQFAAAVSVTNGQRLYIASQNAYQWLQTSNVLSDLITGNVFATNVNPNIAPVVWDSTGVQTLTNSYIFASHPLWWGTNHWPAIGPDASPVTGLIPAQERFLGMTIGLPDIRTLAPAGPF